MSYVKLLTTTDNMHENFQWIFHFHVQEIRWNRVCDKWQYFATAVLYPLVSVYLCPNHTCKPKDTDECCILNSISCNRHNMPSPMAVYSFISIQPWRPGLAGTRAQSCDRYGSGTLHLGQVPEGSLPLLSPPSDVPTLASRWLRPQRR